MARATRRPFPRRALPKSPTGIDGLDEVTGGGLPCGRPTLVCGGAGSGKTLLAATFLVNEATRFGEPGAFMSFEERADDLAKNVASLGFDLRALVAGKKLVVDHVRVEYVAGHTPRSVTALANLEKVCEEHLAGRYTLEVVDIVKNSRLAAGDQIFAVPTLVRRLPPPLKKIIGDFSNSERVLIGLDVRAR